MENDKQQKSKVIVISIVTLFVILCDFYIIVNFPKEYLILTLAVLVTLFCAMIAMNDWFKWKEKEEKDREEQYKNVMQAEKSAYLIAQQKIQDLDNKMNFIGQKIMPLEKAGELNQKKIAVMLDNLMDDQKKIAKITISRSKENADALMNSNDELLHKMGEFQESATEIETQLLSRQSENFQQEMKLIQDNQAELMGKILEFAELLKKDVQEMSENVSHISQAAEEKDSLSNEELSVSEEADLQEISVPESMADEDIDMSDDVSVSAEDTISEEDLSVPEELADLLDSVDVEEAVNEEPLIETSIAESDSEELTEPVSEVEPEQESVIQSVLENPNQMMTPEDIAAILASTEQKEAVSEKPVEEPAIPEPEITADINTQPPKQDNPNQMMSPEDIAALIANTTAEELPETTEKIVEEEKPPMPDISDPNKVMSPEDIAALIANM